MFSYMMLCLQVLVANNTTESECATDDYDVTAEAENANAEPESDCATNDDLASVNT